MINEVECQVGQVASIAHVMSECWSLEQKEPKADLIVHKTESTPTVAQSNLSEY